MHFTYLLPLAALPFSLAKTIDINVGNGALVFSPNNVPAAIGDVLAFHYFPQNHSVAQSSFAAPCVPLAGAATPAIFSGFVPEPASGVSIATTPTSTMIDADRYIPAANYLRRDRQCHHPPLVLLRTGQTLRERNVHGCQPAVSLPLFPLSIPKPSH